jgi:tRNA modification GTPase
MIYALATPRARGALAVFRASGEGCIEALSKVFSPAGKLRDCPTNTCIYGRLLDIDQVVVNVYRNGHGYTGQEAFELMCHGSLSAFDMISAKLEELGFRAAMGGEFTMRAFLSGKMDLTQSEAVQDIVNSDSPISQKQAFSKLQGSLFKAIEAFKSTLLDILAPIELQLDYAQDDIEDEFGFPYSRLEALIKDIDALAATYRTSPLVQEGARVVLAGPVNAGKSTLFNLLLKSDRAIVSPIKGTTRDYLEAPCLIDGHKVRLFDTAGLRQSEDDLEKQGIQRSRLVIEDADLVVYLSPDIQDLESQCESWIRVQSRCDESVSDGPFLKLSCITGQGLEELCHVISSRLGSLVETCDGMMIQSARQAQGLHEASLCLKRAIETSEIGLDLSAGHIGNALRCLGELVGETSSDEMLERIFSSFCVGK